MKKLFFILLSLAVLPSFSFAADVKAPVEKKQEILVKLSHYTDDLHSAYMAVKLANLAQKKGAQVTLFLNLESVRLADTRHPNDLAWGHSLDIGKMIEEGQKAGVQVLVCPHCAMAVGLDAKFLRKGMVLGTEESLGAMLLKADKILDY